MIVENAVALRLYEKLGFEHVRDVEVWTLTGDLVFQEHKVSRAALDDAHAFVREHRNGREPWQRSDDTVARLTELDPAPQGVLAGGGAAVVRISNGRATIVQLGGEAKPVLDAVRGLAESASLLNLPEDDPAVAALRALGGEVAVRQHEMVLDLA